MITEKIKEFLEKIKEFLEHTFWKAYYSLAYGLAYFPINIRVICGMLIVIGLLHLAAYFISPSYYGF